MTLTPERTFTTREVARVTALSLRQLQWWAEQGVLAPAQHNHARQYTEDDLFAAMLYRELRARDVLLLDVRRVQRHLRAQNAELPHPLYRWLVTNGLCTVLLIEGADVLAFLEARRSPAFHVISLAALEQRMQDGIAKLDRVRGAERERVRMPGFASTYAAKMANLHACAM